MINIGPLLPSTNVSKVVRKSQSAGVNAGEKASDQETPPTFVYERRRGQDRRKKNRHTLLDSRAGQDRRKASRKGRSIDIEA